MENEIKNQIHKDRLKNCQKRESGFCTLECTKDQQKYCARTLKKERTKKNKNTKTTTHK